MRRNWYVLKGGRSKIRKERRVGREGTLGEKEEEDGFKI